MNKFDGTTYEELVTAAGRTGSTEQTIAATLALANRIDALARPPMLETQHGYVNVRYITRVMIRTRVDHESLPDEHRVIVWVTGQEGALLIGAHPKLEDAALELEQVLRRMEGKR